MNILLQKQIKKYLSKELINHPKIDEFLNEVSKSYYNFDEELLVLQDVVKVSFVELDEVVAGKVVKESKKLIDLMGLKTQEIVEMSKEREELLKELEYRNKELSDCVQMISHDLKSPLRNIEVLTTWLKEDYECLVDGEGKQTIELIRDNVEKIDSLLEGILEYFTLEKKEMVAYPVNLNFLIQEIIDYIDVPNHIDIRINGVLPIINGDKYRLQQLFKNLILNAILNNDKSKGWVEIGCQLSGDGFQFYVKDNGVGIDEGCFDKLFKAFYKIENNQKSIGLGLSIVKKIVEIYGGSIWVESEVTVGTTFNFLIKNK